CALTMALGTSAGGWRIIKTIGSRMTRLQSWQGFAAQAAASCTIFGASALDNTHDHEWHRRRCRQPARIGRALDRIETNRTGLADYVSSVLHCGVHRGACRKLVVLDPSARRLRLLCNVKSQIASRQRRLAMLTPKYRRLIPAPEAEHI